jgi:hypothetical protein
MVAKQNPETQASPAPAAPVKAPKEVLPKTVEITCVDCGATREVGRGEVFQVKRCKACQELHVKQARKDARKTRVARLRARISVLEGALSEAGIMLPA